MSMCLLSDYVARALYSTVPLFGIAMSFIHARVCLVLSCPSVSCFIMPECVLFYRARVVVVVLLFSHIN